MGTLTGGLLSLMLSWLRGIVALLWRLPAEGGERLLQWFSSAWLPLSLGIIAVGLFCDRVVWLTHFSAGRFAAGRKKKKPRDPAQEETRVGKPEGDWFQELSAGEAERPTEASPAVSPESVPDAELAPYPGMRYDPALAGETRRAAAVKAPPGTGAPPSGEDARRAYEQQMEAYRQQQQQYLRDLAEYERQKAIYDAAAAQEGEEKTEAENETAAGGAKTPIPARRRRRGGA